MIDANYGGNMTQLILYYATNRNHRGPQWAPTSYGKKFSNDGMENLRFGVVKVKASETEIQKYLKKKMGNCGVGDGEKLSEYLTECASSADIEAFEEKIDKKRSEITQKPKLGSSRTFTELQEIMKSSCDVLIYIHGFNVSWYEAVGSALSLQTMLQNTGETKKKNIVVVLFTWPSDGSALPFVSYRSDRSEAQGSGAAVGRALLKTRDYLIKLRGKANDEKNELCKQEIHLACHSMGNFLLQEILSRISDFTPGNALPRIFEHVFLCAPDVDDNALEAGQPLEKINQITRNVTIYHNRGDVAMVISDYTKGNPERLGGAGAAHPGLLHNKVHQVDCTPVVHGLVEHSYYLVGNVLKDIRLNIDGVAMESAKRARKNDGKQKNVWKMKKK